MDSRVIQSPYSVVVPLPQAFCAYHPQHRDRPIHYCVDRLPAHCWWWHQVRGTCVWGSSCSSKSFASSGMSDEVLRFLKTWLLSSSWESALTLNKCIIRGDDRIECAQMRGHVEYPGLNSSQTDDASDVAFAMLFGQYKRYPRYWTSPADLNRLQVWWDNCTCSMDPIPT